MTCRACATEANPIWRDGLLPMADALREQMDAGNIPGGDDGGMAWTEYPTENAAQFFAFLSLVDPDEAARAGYAKRARTLLMSVIGEAAEGQPFRDPYFSDFDRSRWWGAGFPLTVDWIYPLLTAGDKATIRDVFLRWIGENTTATVTGEYNHPQPVGLVNDLALLANPVLLRWAGNNYFTAHMRNIGLMALAFDAADDPDGELTGNLAPGHRCLALHGRCAVAGRFPGRSHRRGVRIHPTGALLRRPVPARPAHRRPGRPGDEGTAGGPGRQPVLGCHAPGLPAFAEPGHRHGAGRGMVGSRLPAGLVRRW